MKIKINYKPRDYQLPFHNNTSRFKVLVWHRGAGKTTACLGELIKQATLKQGVYHFISPTYGQGKRNVWGMLKHLLSDFIEHKLIKTNESEMKVEFMNGSIIYLLGSDRNLDFLRGLDYHGVIFDEYSQQPVNVFSEIIRPRLALTNGRAIWIGTPKGYNNFYEIYKTSQQREGRFGQLLTVNDTKIISSQELLLSKQDMTYEEYQQEYYCSFNAAIKGAYYAKDMAKVYEENRIRKSLYEKELNVYTFWDLGISDYTSIIFAQILNNEIRIVDYYEKNGEGLEHYAKILKEKGYRYEKHYLPHDIRVKELGSGQSRLEILQKMLGETIEITPNIGIKDGIDAVRIIFNKFRFDDDKTEILRNIISQYSQEYDEKTGMFKDRPNHDWTSHGADALRYLAVNYKNITGSINNTVPEIFTVSYDDFLY